MGVTQLKKCYQYVPTATAVSCLIEKPSDSEYFAYEVASITRV